MDHKIITMPSLGEDVSQGAVVDIRVKTGGKVKAGDILLEVETDKVVVEVPADADGEVIEILVSEGDKVRQGIEIIRLNMGSTAQQEAVTEKSASQSEDKEAAVETHVAQSQAEKASAGSEPSEAKGAGSAALKDQSQNQTKDSASSESVSALHSSTESAAASETDQAQPENHIIKAGPSVRRMSRELGVDLERVEGTGTRNSIQKDDVKDYVRSVMDLQHEQVQGQAGVISANNPALGAQAGVVQTNVRSAKPMPNFDDFGPVTRVATTGMQTATADNMVHSWSTIPHAWLQERIDITDLEKSRKKFVSKVKSAGGSFTITVLLAKAIAKVMKEIPIFNAAYDDINGEIIYRDYCDIGVAIDTEKGLVVPSLRDVDKKSLTEIAVEFTDLTMRTKRRKITAKDLSGAGFTLSNLKGMSVSGIFPIINWPQTAILGVADTEWAPVLEGDPENGKFVPRLIMPVTIGFDHRVINGGDAARFLKTLKETLQDPMAMLI